MSGPADEKRKTFASRAEASNLALRLIEQARQEICIYTPRIDPVMFDSSDVVLLLSEFARRNRQTRIRVLLTASNQHAQHGYGLIPLAQKLSNKIYIHLTSRGDQHYHQCLLIDTTGYLYCPTAKRYTGRIEFDAAATASQLQHDFDEYWQRSAPDPNTRQLHL